jgi:hypothetical protein
MHVRNLETSHVEVQYRTDLSIGRIIPRRCRHERQRHRMQGRLSDRPGQPISTPYCRDNYLLASVARKYGFKVSDAAIRNNPSRKEEICRYIGSDIRVQTASEEVLPSPHDAR